MIGGVVRRVSSPVFVGRHAESAQLLNALARAGRGEPSLLLVIGEAGVGKTRLVSESVGAARASGALVLTGDCIELGEGGVPYAPLAEALRSLPDELDADGVDRALGPARADLARLVPSLAGVEAAPSSDRDSALQARLFEHVLGLLGRLGEERTTALVLEDIHWADRSTRDLILFLARTLRRERVVLVATYRSDDLHRRHPLLPLLSALDRSEIVERIELERLGRDEIAGQVAGILDRTPDEELVRNLYRRSDGNPFFVEELVAAGAGPGGETLPSTIRGIVAVRVARLPDTAQSVLRATAVIGRRAGHDLIANLTGLGQTELVEAMRRAVDERILLPIEGSDTAAYEFRHALVQEALYHELLPAERTTLHARVASILETTAQSPDQAPMQAEIAYHWYRAHELPKALGASVRAADEARLVFAFAEAQAHFERALELWPSVPDAPERAGNDRPRIVEMTADAAAAAGELARAIALGRAALEGLAAQGDLDRWLSVSHRLAWYQWDHGDARAAEQTVRDALAASVGAEPLARARLLSDLAQSHWSAARYAAQRDAAREAVELSVGAADRVEEARARMMFGAAMVSLGDVFRGMEELERAKALVEHGPEDLRSFVAVELTHSLSMAGMNARGAERGREEVERARRNGTFRRYGVYLLTNLIDCLISIGLWDEAQGLIDDPDWPRDGSRASIWMFQDAAEIACMRGDLSRARSAMAAAHDRLTLVAGEVDRMWMERGDALLARAEGRFGDASHVLWTAIQRSADPVHDLPMTYWILPLAISTEADLAQDAEAHRDEAGAMAARARGHGLDELVEQIAAASSPTDRGPFPTALLALWKAERARRDGRPDPDAWSAAAAAFDAVDETYTAAVARCREAEAILMSGGDRRRATDALQHAHRVALRLGAEPLLGDVASLARRARIDLAAADVPQAPAEPTSTDPYGLSPREREVIALVAAGRTNREIGQVLFISEKTSSVHVTHILDKLGVSSRVEAAIVASRAGLLDAEVPG